ncbi:MAG: hypothetical protein WCT11_00815 [Candidatus Magasanikbacteria bacterium]
MQFQPFYQKIREIKPLFSKKDAELLFPTGDISSQQLSRWCKQGYLLKIKNGLYLLSGYENQVPNFFIANAIYYPSYVSLETALYEYGFIPDVPHTITSVTTKKTSFVKINLGQFSYRKIKTDCFIGYEPKRYLKFDVLFASPEKALVDFFYLNKQRLQKSEQITELRLNYFSLKEKIDKEKLRHYGSLYKSPLLDRLLKELINQF